VNPGRVGRPRGENNSAMLWTILFPKYSTIGCEVAVCHIHCRLRILVDGCNNSSILSNHLLFHFVPPFVVYPFLVLVILCSLPVL
jgi:hypothetical protein